MRGVVVVGFAMACALISGCDAVNDFSEAKEAASRNLKDPAATQFRDVQSCPSDSNVTMGELNAKNSFGAYTGFKPFFYADGNAVMLDDYDFEAMMTRCYGKNDSSKSVDTSELANDAAEAAQSAAQAAASGAARVQR